MSTTSPCFFAVAGLQMRQRRIEDVELDNRLNEVDETLKITDAGIECV